MRAPFRFCACLLLVAPLCARADERTLTERLRGPLVAAHRGGHPFPDSNTVERFEAARLEGADIVETDLQVSSDGVPFLFHDGNLAPATACKGPVSAHTAAEIEACPLVGLSHGPERFEKALEWSQGRVIVDAELKTAEVVRPAVELVQRYRAWEWVYFQVRNGWDRYADVRVLDDRIAVEAGPQGRRAEAELAQLLAMKDPRIAIIQLHPDTLTKENLARIHASGKLASIDAWYVARETRLRFWPWHTPSACAQVFAQGVDIAVTNTPRACAEQRDATARRAAR
ncbi:MAG TPA: glycerophosphodiester phosphodiesterase family protein [Myxococcota bacterium]|nr:glycerophosphodiester phosphodiesterase family protein [Myxococcota bacterium]